LQKRLLTAKLVATLRAVNPALNSRALRRGALQALSLPELRSSASGHGTARPLGGPPPCFDHLGLRQAAWSDIVGPAASRAPMTGH
jgi:hypothetical protein